MNSLRQALCHVYLSKLHASNSTQQLAIARKVWKTGWDGRGRDQRSQSGEPMLGQEHVLPVHLVGQTFAFLCA